MILISIGHHDKAKGASYGDFNEYDEATIWCKFIVSMLSEEALLVPPGTLSNKVSYINKQDNVSCCAEIHFNSALDQLGNHVGKGCETLYSPGSLPGKNLADCVQEQLSKVFQPNRGSKEGWYRMDKKYGPDFFLVKTKVPSIIIEPEFIHNVEKIKNNREEGSFAIAKGLQNFILERAKHE